MDKMDIVEIYRDVELFEGTSEEFINKVAEISQEKTFALGEMIFEEGEKANWVYFLLEGKVRISIDLTSKPTYVTVAMIDECIWPFGWSGIVAPYRYTATATCEVETKVLAIPGIQFEEFMMQEPNCGCSVMKKLTELISSRLRNSRMTLLRTI
jgi:CRP/FNR family transcriptional regulator